MAWTSGECGKRPFDDGGSSGGFAVRFSKCGTNVRLGQKVSTEKNRDLGLCRDTSALQVISEAKACPIRRSVPHFEVPAEFRGTRSGCAIAAACRESAVPLILLHGFAQSSASWNATASELAATGRPVYALDLVGHGGSERPANPRAYALDAQGEALLAFAEELRKEAS